MEHRGGEQSGIAKFSITRIVARPREAIYALATDAESYADFIPSFADAQVRPAGENRLEVMPRVRYKDLRQE